MELNRRGAVLIETDYTRRYHNCIYQIARLSKSEHLLLTFLSQVMDDNNIVINNIALRTDFNDILIKIGDTPYTDSTIQKCFRTLLKYEFLEKVKGRGFYLVNPIFFYRGNDFKEKNSHRDSIVRNYLERNNKMPALPGNKKKPT